MPIDTYPSPNFSTASAVLGYAEVTANQTAIAPAAALTGYSVTVSVPAGRRLKVTGHVPTIQPSDITTGYYVEIVEDGTQVGRCGIFPRMAGGTDFAFADGSAIRSPVAGTHTYTLLVNRYTGAGTISAFHSTTDPGFLLVEDVTGGTGGSGPIQLAYAEVTANQGSITAEVDLTGLAVTVAVPAGRRIRIRGLGRFSNATGGDGAILYIKEGSTYYHIADGISPAAGNEFTLYSEAVITPTAGTHTFILRAQNYVGGTATLVASANGPASILVEDITGTPMSVENLAWIPYTPTWIATGTAPALGNGTLAGRYTRIGRTIMGIIYHQMGSTTTYGTGNWQWSLPVAPYIGSSPWPVVGAIKGYQSGNSLNALARIYNGTSYLHGVYSATWPGGAETPITNVAPWTWTTSNTLDINFMYEAAS